MRVARWFMFGVVLHVLTGGAAMSPLRAQSLPVPPDDPAPFGKPFLATQPAAGSAVGARDMSSPDRASLLQQQSKTFAAVGNFGQSSPFAPLMPSLATAGAPYWLKPGVRLSYYLAVAHVPLTDHYFYRDDEGGWVDDQGNRYKREATVGGGGEGISQVNITCVDPRAAVAHVRTYSYMNRPGPLVPLQTTGAIVAPGIANDWWIHPDCLRQVRDGNSGRVRVLRGPYTVSGKTYSAVRFETRTPDSQMVYTYDQVTGLMLHYHQIVYGADKQTLMSSTFVEWRTVRYPWANAPMPAWLRVGAQLQFDGARVITVPGADAMSMPAFATMSVVQKEPRWVRYTQRSMAQMPGGLPQTPSEVDLVTGPCQFGGIWVSPEGLRTLRLGQTLDQDRAARTTTGVTRADSGVVQISEQGEMHLLTFTYDTAQGMLVNSTYSDNYNHSQNSLTLRR